MENTRKLIIQLIIEPLAAFFALIFLTIIISILFYWRKPTKSILIILEVTWLMIGFMSVLYLVNENKAIINKNKIDNIKYKLDSEENWIYTKQYEEGKWCFKILDTDTLVKTNFGLVSAPYCYWMKEVIDNIRAAREKGYNNQIKLPELNLKSKEDYINYGEFLKDVKDLNILIKERLELIDNKKGFVLSEFKQTLGILILIFAFALRISIAIYKSKENEAH